MTAAHDWDLGGPSGSDAELARASAAGDRRAFAGIYDRYADRLHDFCVGMLRDRDGAADCVQDVFCIAATRLPQLREPDKLRPWLYSIARNEALRRIRERRREEPSDELPDTATGEPGPDTLAARTELADLIADAAGGLSERDRTVLELAFRHGLDGPDLAEALGVSPSNANTLVHRLRGTIERSLGALLVSRRVRNTGGCPELAAMLEGWDGHFNVLMRKRISRHIEPARPATKKGDGWSVPSRCLAPRRCSSPRRTGCATAP
jgi:RNA polymerase sigma factor (sigma-70 family)